MENQTNKKQENCCEQPCGCGEAKPVKPCCEKETEKGCC
jgi:hypothetical protein